MDFDELQDTFNG